MFILKIYGFMKLLKNKKIVSHYILYSLLFLRVLVVFNLL